MAQHLRLANTQTEERQIGDFVWTATAKNIRRSVELLRSSDGTAMTMISGPPGSGKTSALKQLTADLKHEVIFIQAARGEGTIREFSKNFFKNFIGGAPAYSSLSDARELLQGYMHTQFQMDDKWVTGPRMLIVDEAQYLDQRNARTGQRAETFEWLRAAAEQAPFKLVFCGDKSLENVIARFPQLQSRMIRPILIKSVEKNDIAALVDGTLLAIPEALHALHAVAQLAGGLRNVENVLRIAHAFAGGNDPTLQHLKAAIMDMQLAPRGVKKGAKS